MLSEKKLIGMRMMMSFGDNKTGELWRAFMPRRKEITNAFSNELVSMQIYPCSHDFSKFSPAAKFEKWAAVEVSNFDIVPQGMERTLLPAGLYAVFIHKGSSRDTSVFQYILGTWLPNSEFQIDERPHFEILGEKYKNDDPESEEEIWIPIRNRDDDPDLRKVSR
jgi:AraC family transcriptional regulator